MSGYRDPEPKETREHTFRARYIRRDMMALAVVGLAFAMGLALVVPPKTEVHCLQVSRTCTVDRTYLGFVPVHELLDLRGAIGPARIAGRGKQRYVAVQMDGGGEGELGGFGEARSLVAQAVTAFCLTRSDTDASHDGIAQIALLLLGLALSALQALGPGRERVEVTLRSDGARLQVNVRRRWGRTRTLDFSLHDLTAFEGRIQTRRNNRGGPSLYYRLEAKLPHQHEEVLPEQLDHPALHLLTAQLNHFLDTLPERRDRLVA